MNALDDFLKGRFEKHLGTCCFTKPSFAFDKTKTTTESCEACELPMKVTSYTSDRTPLPHDVLLDDCCEKLELYMGHRVRVKNPRDAIDKIMDAVKNNQALLLIDYEMKFECKCCREKTSEFYGKKGLS